MRAWVLRLYLKVRSSETCLTFGRLQADSAREVVVGARTRERALQAAYFPTRPSRARVVVIDKPRRHQ